MVGRSRVVFYGGALSAIAAVGLAFTPWFPNSGLETVTCHRRRRGRRLRHGGVWRDEHTYSY